MHRDLTICVDEALYAATRRVLESQLRQNRQILAELGQNPPEVTEEDIDDLVCELACEAFRANALRVARQDPVYNAILQERERPLLEATRAFTSGLATTPRSRSRTDSAQGPKDPRDPKAPGDSHGDP